MASNNDVDWGALAGIGFQMLVAVLAGWFGGEWIDGKYNCAPWGVVVCTLIGVAAGMYAMIREGMRINRDPPGPKPG